MNELIALITIISTIIFAVTSIYGKVIIKDVQSSYNFFLMQIILFIPILTVVNILIQPDLTYLFSWLDMTKLVLASIFGFTGYVALYKGFEVGNVSVGGVMLSSRVLVSIPLAIFIGEIYPLFIYVFIAIAFMGAMLVSYREDLSIKDFLQLKSSGLNYFLVTLVSWALANTLTRELNNHFHPLLFLYIRIIFFAIIAIITYPILKKSLSNGISLTFNKKSTNQIILYILILLTAQMMYIYALGESLTIAEGLGVLEGVFTFMMAIGLSKINFFKNYLEEPLGQLTLIVRVFGVLITTLGTIGILYILQTL